MNGTISVRSPRVRGTEERFESKIFFFKRRSKEVGQFLPELYLFPKEHWPHLRTTNVVESPFSSVRLRTDAAKRFKKVHNATAMIWKLLQVADKNFRTFLKGHWLLPDVYAGKTFVDGVVKREQKRL